MNMERAEIARVIARSSSHLLSNGYTQITESKLFQLPAGRISYLKHSEGYQRLH